MPASRRTLLRAGLGFGMAASFDGTLVMTAAQSDPISDTAAGPLRPGVVTLIVRNLDEVARYYRETIGFEQLDGDRDEVRLGAGGRALLRLRRRADAEREPSGFAGLFHTAFLLPARADLGRWLARAIGAGVLFDGASDHKVSEALYLSDPEGNGIEIYADRPRHSWKWNGDIVQMATDALDVEGLVEAGGPMRSDAPAAVPDGTIVGHMHLRVGGIPEAEAFYRDVLGLAVTARRPGATFYATGGYHHHVATNVWQSRNAPKRSGTITGLASFELLAQDQTAFDTAAERMLAAGGRRDGDAVIAADPWQNRVVLKRL